VDVTVFPSLPGQEKVSGKPMKVEAETAEAVMAARMMEALILAALG
jgi:hypothetical protein